MHLSFLPLAACKWKKGNKNLNIRNIERDNNNKTYCKVSYYIHYLVVCIFEFTYIYIILYRGRWRADCSLYLFIYVYLYCSWEMTRPWIKFNSMSSNTTESIITTTVVTIRLFLRIMYIMFVDDRDRVG